MIMASSNLRSISRTLGGRQYFSRRRGVISNILAVERNFTTKKTYLIENLQPTTKYGCIQVKAARIVPAECRLASTCTARKVSRSIIADPETSGSSSSNSGQEDGDIEKIHIRYTASYFIGYHERVIPLGLT